MSCLECELLELQGVEFEVITNFQGEHVRHIVIEVD